MQKMGLNPLELTSGHKFEPVQGLNSLLIGLVWPFKRSCLAFGLESLLDPWSKIYIESEQGLKSWGWFFHPDWSCLTFQKLFELAIRLWITNGPLVATLSLYKVSIHYPEGDFLIQNGPVWPFKKITIFVIVIFLFIFVCYINLFDSFLVVLPRVLRFPP